MVCTFIGHRDTSMTATLRKQLQDAIITLINHGVKLFYVGNNGSFDLLVQDVLLKVVQSYPSVRFDVVLSAINEKPLIEKDCSTIFPEELELVPKRFAISKRNDYMIKHASFIISYVSHPFSNSIKFIEKAQQRGCTIINLATN